MKRLRCLGVIPSLLLAACGNGWSEHTSDAGRFSALSYEKDGTKLALICIDSSVGVFLQRETPPYLIDTKVGARLEESGKFQIMPLILENAGQIAVIDSQADQMTTKGMMLLGHTTTWRVPLRTHMQQIDVPPPLEGSINRLEKECTGRSFLDTATGPQTP